MKKFISLFKKKKSTADLIIEALEALNERRKHEAESRGFTLDDYEELLEEHELSKP